MATPNQTAGLIFPLVLTSGRHTLSEYMDLIKSSLKIILSWPMYTRFYEGEFGSRIHEVIEEPNDDILINLIRRFVIDSISTWEKRIELTNLSIFRQAPEKLTIDLTYRIRELNLEDNFYYNYPIQ
jgi:phage baseplate assembly protein W